MSLLTLNAINKQYGDTLVLHNITFLINPVDKIGLVGANGVGRRSRPVF